ncbi:MAG: TlpA family protein disulfide reductase [Lachnospiraceae bacterium]|nr:TlpA family protein disulfide reductase [Lachnospiraceae bacterium]
MPSFTTKDLDGNMVTEDIFGEKDLTVVNIWGTFCPPCIAEMPDLGEWADAMPDNVQIVGLIVDISGDEDTQHHDLAVTITQKAGAEFMHLIANEDFNDILNQVVGVPTTLFVDKEGNLVGTPIVGANVDGYKTFAEDYLNE